MVDTHLDATPAQMQAFAAVAPDGPIDMLNLLRFRALAAYPEGHALSQDGLSGAAAYARYGAATAPLLAKVGGQLLWHQTGGLTLIGPEDAQWDSALLVRYPDTSAFLQMIRSGPYREAVIHRQAALETSRLIRWPGAGADIPAA